MVPQADQIRFKVRDFRSYWLNFDNMEDVMLFMTTFLD
jgi:hypothetical protein